MRQLTWTGRGVVAVVLAAVLVGAVATGLALGARADSSSLPACADLAGTRLGSLDEGPGWQGCLTEGGAAVQSYRYECSGLRRVSPPNGDEERLADEAAVVFLPDAGLVAATGQDWVRSPYPSYPAVTPFAMLMPYRCDELRSRPHDDLAPVGCSLDELPLDLRSTQGCSQDGAYHAAVGRTCVYPDWDIGVLWEQWSIDVPDRAGRPDAYVLESDPDELWQMTVPEGHRDERCSTHPDAWDPAWR